MEPPAPRRPLDHSEPHRGFRRGQRGAVTERHPLGRGRARLGIVIATFNRRASLEQALDAIERTTMTPYTIVVVDGGSTDGTLQLLEERGIDTIRQSGREGSARAYNEGFAALDTEYVVWLSDDTDVLPHALDTTVAILDRNLEIGMVGLKMLEAKWGLDDRSRYARDILSIGAIYCHHGVLRLDLLRRLGGFHEPYRAYMIDPDLTVAVLASGARVVMTRKLSVLHRRQAPVDPGTQSESTRPDGRHHAIFHQRWGWLADVPDPRWRGRTTRWLRGVIGGVAPRWPGRGFRLGLCRRDLQVLAGTRWTSPLDPVLMLGRPYHLVQQLPRSVVRDPRNTLRRA